MGAETRATHEVVAQGPERALVRQRIEQRGPLGVVVGLLTRRMTRRYLDLEARGLKARSERAPDNPARSERAPEDTARSEHDADAPRA